MGQAPVRSPVPTSILRAGYSCRTSTERGGDAGVRALDTILLLLLLLHLCGYYVEQCYLEA